MHRAARSSLRSDFAYGRRIGLGNSRYAPPVKFYGRPGERRRACEGGVRVSYPCRVYVHRYDLGQLCALCACAHIALSLS